MSYFASGIVDAARASNGYARQLLQGVAADRFARTPEGVETNHPAWVFGHLATYPDLVMLPLIGKTDLAQPTDEWNELFGMQSTCRDDADGSIYPSMELITSKYFDRTEALLGALIETGDETLSRQVPDDFPLKDRTPSVGGALIFLLTSHTMIHFGQISAWRRLMDYGPCM